MQNRLEFQLELFYYTLFVGVLYFCPHEVCIWICSQNIKESQNKMKRVRKNGKSNSKE